MTHNFYLYHDPGSGQLTWISWDHNFVLGASAGGPAQAGAGNGGGFQPAPGGGPRGGRGGMGSTSLDKADVGENWPLIRYLLDDPVYSAQYVGYLAETVNGVFNADALAARYQALAELVAPYADQAGETAAFEQAIQQLTDLTYARVEAVNAFLAAR